MRPIVALIDYGSGNLRSAEKALARAAEERTTNHEIVVTSDARVVADAERLVLPGVGAFADCMAGLSALPGMIETLTQCVLVQRKPFLGICVGMQLMATVGREFGDRPGLGWIEGDVIRLAPSDPSLKIPQMGWNELSVSREHPLLSGMARGAHVYFLHSYAMKPARQSDLLATTEYGGAVVAAIARENYAGMQFHPEKSQGVGLRLLGNFLAWRP
ncbi:MAG TPA: imidazole glycerol phosphate synthase subunit HisH [Rhizomicrobium sp.]|jgi:glutamine amidotransferase